MIVMSRSHHNMIQLTRFNNETFMLNALLIEQVQSYPDTTISLTNGKILVVKESESQVVELITDFYCKVGVHIWSKEAGEDSET